MERLEPKPITDPKILAKLNEGGGELKPKPITDPKVLAKLEGGKPPLRPKPITDYETLKKLEGYDDSIGGRLKSFWHAGLKNIDEYGASAAKLFGADDWQKHFNDRKRYHEARITNKWSGLGGEVLLDPLNMAPAGIVSKGSKMARVAKSMAGGAAVGAATMAAKNYGDDAMSGEQRREEIAFGAGLASVLNGAIAALTKGRVTNAVKTPEDLGKEEVRATMVEITKNPERFGLKPREAERVEEEYVTRLREVERKNEVKNDPAPQNHPHWRDEAASIREGADTLFANGGALGGNFFTNGGVNLAVGTGMGTVNAFNTLADGGSDEEAADAFVHGLLTGTLGVEAIRAFRKMRPEAFKRASQWVKAHYGPDGKATKPEAVNAFMSKMEKKEKRGIYNVTFNDKESTRIRLNDLDDFFEYSKGSRKYGAKHVLLKHYGDGKVGELTKDEILRFGEVVRDGTLVPESIRKTKYGTSRAYVLEKNGVKYTVIIEEQANGKKFISGFSDRNVEGWLTKKEGEITRDRPPSNKTIPQDGDGVKIGMFAGTNAKGWKEAEEAGRTFDGRYDNQPRFEIDDSRSAMRGNVEGRVRLGDVLEHEELYRNYPRLADLPVVADANLKKGQAAFDPVKGEIRVSPDETDRRVLLHEIQHWIQREEGFASGGSIEEEYLRLKGELDNLRYEADMTRDPFKKAAIERRIEALESGDLMQKARERYRNVAGEIEARDVEARADYDEVDRMIREPYTSENIPTEKARVVYRGKVRGLDGGEVRFMREGDEIDEAALEKFAVPEPPKRSILELVRTFSRPVETPIGEFRVDIDYLLNKAVERDGGLRIDTLHMVEPTLREPAFVVNYRGSFNFIKPFIGKDGRTKEFLSVISDRNGNVKFVTAYKTKKADVRKILRDGKMIVDNLVGGATPAGRGSTGSRLAEANPKSGYSIDQSIPQNDGGVKLGMFGGSAPKGADGGGKGLFAHSFDDLERLAKERMAKEWEDLGDIDGLPAFKRFMKTAFTDTFSGAYHRARETVHERMNEHYEKIGRLAKLLEPLDEATDKQMYRYLTKTGGENLPKELKEAADTIRDTIDSLGRQLVDRGLLTEEAYKEWAGAYLRRQYESKMGTAAKGFLSGFKLDKMHERGVSGEFRKSDLNKIVGWLHKQGFVDDAELVGVASFEELKKRLEAAGKVGLLREGKLKIEERPGGKVKLRRDFTKAEREAMGEIESAKLSVPETLARMYRLKEHAEFLERVREVDGAVLGVKEAKKYDPQELRRMGYARIDNDPRYGALAGRWVRQDVADDIGRTTKDLLHLHKHMWHNWLAYQSLWKKSKTVWNPAAHLNNFTGNLFLMHLAGVNGAKIPQVLAEGARQMKALSRIEALEAKLVANRITDKELEELGALREKAKYAQEAKKLGIFGKSQLNDILAGMEKKAARRGVLQKLDEKAEKAYQWEDNFNRLSFYVTLRQAGKAPRVAKEMVDMMLPDYTRPLPSWWAKFRDYGVTPFISWAYYAVPNIVRMAKTRTGRRKVLNMLAAISLMEYFASGGRVTPADNLPFVEGDKPEDFKGRRFVIGHDGNEMTTLKLDRVVPYLEMQNPVNMLKSQFSGILPNLVYTMQGQDMYSRRNITYPNKSAGDKTIDWLKHLTAKYAPVPVPAMSAANFIDSIARSGKRRKRNDVIKPRTPEQELMKLFGINTLTYDRSKVGR